jgi:hypothetical protein
MLRHAALVRTDIFEESITSISQVTRIGELGTTLAVTSNQGTLHYTPENGIFHSHYHENLKSYISMLNSDAHTKDYTMLHSCPYCNLG